MRTKPIMRNKMLRSALVAAFSAVVAFGTLSGLAGAKGDDRTDGSRGSVHISAAASDEHDSSWGVTPALPADSSWG
ncbi:hypothetical protein PV435_33875 [Streptomyces scabiei]|nr:hypothetical protein [Streptomyces scabiei]